MAKLTIEDISHILAEKNGLSREAAAAFAREMFAVVQNAVERDKLVKVKGLGAFKVVDVEARESINVNTGERVLIEGHGKISFTPDSTMKELVNKPFSQFETVVLNDGVSFDDIPTPDEEEKEEEEQPQVIVEEKSPRVEEALKEVEQALKEVEEAPHKEEVIEEETPRKEEEEESPIEEEDDEESPNSDTAKWIVAGVISLVLIVLAACGGYIYGLNKGRAEADSLIAANQEQKPQAPQSKDSLLAALHPEEPVVLDTTAKQLARDTTAKAEPKADPQKVTQRAETKAEPKPKSEPKPKVESSDKYERMDARVRTGAYRIVGIDRTITVKKGETVKRISKTYLGEGMECYVEVINGLSGNSELKEGSKLKIPKLELKKRGK